MDRLRVSKVSPAQVVERYLGRLAVVQATREEVIKKLAATRSIFAIGFSAHTGGVA